MKKKVLFSTTWGPYTEQFFNTSPTDVMNQRFSRGCDIFSLSGHLHINFAHLIAQNIELPSVFLEYPGRDDFAAEIEKGYDYVAISSFQNQVDDLVEMCRLVRARAPQTKIVLGGWGAVGLEATCDEQELGQLCDHLCHGEGIRFFRQLLGEDVERPMFHSHLPQWSYSLPMVTRYPRGTTPVVVGSVGCPNGCDFCGTTEMFSGCRRQVMTPEQVHREFQRAWRENPDIPQATLLEEDTFQNKEYLTELGRLLREDSEFGLAYYNFFCLASIRSMSEWTFEEMALTGCSVVFVGVESNKAGDHGYGKTVGISAKEMFDGLHNAGISTTGAWMVGFDFQDRQNIEEDLQRFIELCPTSQQLTRVCPFPPTPMWRQLRSEGRIPEQVPWQDVSFYGGGGLAPKNFSEHEVMNLIERGYRELYETHGAIVARLLDVSMNGYEFCMERRHRNDYLVDRALYHKRMALTFFPLLKAMAIYAPNNTVRKKMKDMRRRSCRLFGEPTGFLKSAEAALVGLSGLNKFLDIIYPRDNFITEEGFRRYVYDKPAPLYPECPYSLEWPHRTRRDGLEESVKRGLRSVVGGMQTFSLLVDKARGIPQDAATLRGVLDVFF